MPDQNGNSTLRDKYPIYCAACGGKIHPAYYDADGELLSPSESYWINRILLGPDGIPFNEYVHQQCGEKVRVVRRRKAASPVIHTCLYCAQPSEDDFCSERCRMLHEQEVADRVPSAATLELLQRLTEIRDEYKKQEPERPALDHNNSTVKNNGPTAKPNAQINIDASQLAPFVPQNEMGVVFMFGQVIERIGYRMAHIDGRYPDAVIVSSEGQAVKVEFEYVASNFIAHGHDPNLCDLVVCWGRDRKLSLPTIALEHYYDCKTGRWNFATVTQS